METIGGQIWNDRESAGIFSLTHQSFKERFASFRLCLVHRGWKAVDLVEMHHHYCHHSSEASPVQVLGTLLIAPRKDRQHCLMLQTGVLSAQRLNDNKGHHSHQGSDPTVEHDSTQGTQVGPQLSHESRSPSSEELILCLERSDVSQPEQYRKALQLPITNFL